MNEQRLIDANALYESWDYGSKNDVYEYHPSDVLDSIIDCPTIDPETLPIVQELRGKLERYEKAEQKGRLVELPCKVGDTVYYLTGNPSLSAKPAFNRVEQDRVDGFYFDERSLQIRLHFFHGNHGTYGFFGKTIFLTREEAEAALKERYNDGRKKVSCC